MKKAVKEPPYIDSISLDLTIYFRCLKMLEDYFQGKGCLDEESFVIATQNSKVIPNIGLMCYEGESTSRQT